MALFKILRGKDADLFAINPDTNEMKVAPHDGYAYFTPDKGYFYVDCIVANPETGEETLQRIQLKAKDAENAGHAMNSSLGDYLLHNHHAIGSEFDRVIPSEGFVKSNFGCEIRINYITPTGSPDQYINEQFYELVEGEYVPVDRGNVNENNYQNFFIIEKTIHYRNFENQTTEVTLENYNNFLWDQTVESSINFNGMVTIQNEDYNPWFGSGLKLIDVPIESSGNISLAPQFLTDTNKQLTITLSNVEKLSVQLSNLQKSFFEYGIEVGQNYEVRNSFDLVTKAYVDDALREAGGAVIIRRWDNYIAGV